MQFFRHHARAFLKSDEKLEGLIGVSGKEASSGGEIAMLGFSEDAQ